MKRINTQPGPQKRVELPPASEYKRRQRAFAVLTRDVYLHTRRTHRDETRHWCLEQARQRIYEITGELRTLQGLIYILKREGAWDDTGNISTATA